LLKLVIQLKKTISVILTTAAGGGAPCGGGKKAGFTCGAGAVGWPVDGFSCFYIIFS
jgi:hypothetical protein